MTKKISVFFIIFFTFSFLIYLQSVKVIKDPKPTHFEKKFVRLKMIKKVGYDFDDENFIGKVGSVTADREGNLYIYDSLQTKIFKLNKNLKLVKGFGSKGRGPGEFGSRVFSVVLNVGSDNKLYAADNFNKKIHMFDLNGKLIADYPIKYKRRFLPVVTISGDFIIPSSSDDNSLNLYSKDLNIKKVLIKRKSFDKFLFYKPGYLIIEIVRRPDYETNLFYRLSDDNKLIVIIGNDMTYFLFKDFKLIRKRKILPALILDDFKKYATKNLVNTDDTYGPLISRCFFDSDDSNFFYLQFFRDEKKGWDILYKFSTKGDLIKVLYIKANEKNVYSRFLLKRNNIFYVNDINYMYLFKE